MIYNVVFLSLILFIYNNKIYLNGLKKSTFYKNENLCLRY